MASSVPATMRRTSSVFTNVPSWPCLRIDFRIGCVDQYACFFEMTPTFNLGHPRSLEPRCRSREKNVSRPRMTRLMLYRRSYIDPGRETERMHPVVARQPAKGDRTAIGAVEEVVIRGSKGDIRVLARVDTGAARTSLDTDLALRAGLGPVFDRVRVRAAAADEPEERDVVDAKILIAGREFDVAVSGTGPQGTRDPQMHGVDGLPEAGFLVDPSKGDE